MDVISGWKISHFVEGARTFDYSDKSAVKQVVRMLKKLHDYPVESGIEIDAYKGGLRLLTLAEQKKTYLKKELKQLLELSRKVYLCSQLDDYPKSMCHNDPYAVNFLVAPNGSIDIIDWEYSGYGDPANDIGSIVCRDRLTEDQFNEILVMYFDREPTAFEKRHFYAGLALAGWYWFCWSLAKDSIGDDLGFWYLESYRTARDMSQKALSLYEM